MTSAVCPKCGKVISHVDFTELVYQRGSLSYNGDDFKYFGMHVTDQDTSCYDFPVAYRCPECRTPLFDNLDDVCDFFATEDMPHEETDPDFAKLTVSQLENITECLGCEYARFCQKGGSGLIRVRCLQGEGDVLNMSQCPKGHWRNYESQSRRRET